MDHVIIATLLTDTVESGTVWEDTAYFNTEDKVQAWLNNERSRLAPLSDWEVVGEHAFELTTDDYTHRAWFWKEPVL